MQLIKKPQQNIDLNKVKELSVKFKISEEIVKLMFLREIDTEEKINNFLNPNISNMHDPYLLQNMKQVVSKIEKAIEDKKRILIYGDYDVDGISATSILYLYLRSRRVDTSYFLPNRYKDGYGLTIDAIKKINKKYNPDLIITVDCGITAVEEVDWIKKEGIDIIITDHHEVPETTPDCLIINPKIKDQDYPFNELCGAGVALKVVQALGGIEAVKKYIDIASIATIADIVSLTDENRLIVQLGLKQIETKTPIGLKLLLNDLNLKSKVTSTEIAFKVAPKINAAGRMGDASKGLKLFIKRDKKQLYMIVQNLLELNTRRQELCQKVYDDAIEKLSKINMANEKIIILSDPTWDSGLLGITAARLVDEFNKPTILFSEVEGKHKGSARSIDGLNIHEAIRCLTVPLDAFGGHTMAAGLTVDDKHYKDFVAQAKDCVNNKFDLNYFYPKKYYDIDINPQEISLDFVKELQLLAPFGHENPMPIFNLNFTYSKVNAMKKFPEHLTINFNNSFSLLNFNGNKNLPNFDYYTNKNALIELQVNNFKGRESAKGVVKTLKFNNINLNKVEDFVMGHYVKQTAYKTNNKARFTLFNDSLEELLNSLNIENGLGNLVVFSSLESYKENEEVIKKFNLESNLFNINNKLGLNSYVLGLNQLKNLNSFNNIIFVDKVYNNNFIAKINQLTEATVYLNSLALDKEFMLNSQREEFGKYFNAIKFASNRNINANNVYEYYTNLKRLNPNIKNFNYTQFVFVLEVFTQLNIVKQKITDTNYSLKINKGVNSELKNSYIYRHFLKNK